MHQAVSEQRLQKMGLVNYWGYNTLNFFTPHAAYASRAAQFGGTGAVLREFKGMVRLLHEAGLEVVLDVVYNHTAEEGRGGPTSSLRGLDDAHYYRHLPDGSYLDTTGCGNTIDYSTPAAQRLVLDSLRYWANEVQIDGFRFDLAATLGRDADAEFTPEHPLLKRSPRDPQLEGVKLIAEPWDVGKRRLAGRQLRLPAGRSGTTATATACATSGCATSRRRAVRAASPVRESARSPADWPDRTMCSRWSAARSPA